MIIKKEYLFLILGLIVGLIPFFILLVVNNMATSQTKVSTSIEIAKITPKITLTQTPTPTTKPTVSLPTPFPTSSDPNLKRFTSQTLGISFTYLENQDGQKFLTKEEDNKVYVYMENSGATTGQSIEMFSKDPKQSLIEAIQNKFLISFNKSDCLVQLNTNLSYPTNFQAAQINVPQDSNDDMGTLSDKWARCPEKYTTQNGISYFLENISKPEKFYYLSIGQYGIASDKGNAWQKTIIIF